MRIKLDVNEENYESVKRELESLGIKIDNNSEFVLSENNTSITYLTVKSEVGDRVKISVGDIVFIESCGKDVFVHTTSESYKTQERIYQIEEVLDPKLFVRVSNSVIIARKHVKKIRPGLSMKFILTMTGGTLIDVTRSYYSDFKKFFGI